MTNTDATTAAPAKPQKSFGHRLLMRYGQKLSRKLAVFQGNQSLVGNEPVIDVAHFPEFKVLEDNWTDILAEVKEI
jgi:aspartyl/asparaginyl beta-hydroxylase (cupin superfamily)